MSGEDCATVLLSFIAVFITLSLWLWPIVEGLVDLATRSLHAISTASFIILWSITNLDSALRCSSSTHSSLLIMAVTLASLLKVLQTNLAALR